MRFVVTERGSAGGWGVGIVGDAGTVEGSCELGEESVVASIDETSRWDSSKKGSEGSIGSLNLRTTAS